MTDALPPPEDLDLLAAAIVDGEADRDLLARLDRDPDLQERVEAQRRAQQALRAPIAPLAAVDVDALVARALDATDAAPPDSSKIVTSRHDRERPEPRPLSPRRRHGPGAGGRTVVPWLVAAAVVLVLALAAVALPLTRGDRSSDSASSPASGDTSSAGGDAGSSPLSGAPLAGPAEAAGATDLGSGTPDELAVTALSRVPGRARAGDATPVVPSASASAAPSAGSGNAADRATGQTSTAPTACAAVLAPGAPVELLGTGQVGGAPVDVVVVGPVAGSSSGPTALVLGPGCTVLARRTG